MLHALDPRDPSLQPTPEYLRFRAALAASEHIHVLASMIRNTALLYDGDLHDHGPLIEERYLRAAELAVRYCSEEARASASRMAEAHAISRFEQLQADLKSPDATETHRTELVAQFADDVCRVFCFHLMHACGRSPQEAREFRRLEARGE